MTLDDLKKSYRARMREYVDAEDGSEEEAAAFARVLEAGAAVKRAEETETKVRVVRQRPRRLKIVS